MQHKDDLAGIAMSECIRHLGKSRVPCYLTPRAT